jgi:hypothetical protein
MFLHKGLAWVFVSAERKKNIPIFSFGMFLCAPNQAVTTSGSFCLSGVAYKNHDSPAAQSDLAVSLTTSNGDTPTKPFTPF